MRKKRSMHRSVTDSIAHQQTRTKTIDDAAFIFNRASINDYFHQRSSLREYNNRTTTTVNNDNKLAIINSQRINNDIDENYQQDVNLIQEAPTCLQLSYFKKETSI